MVFVIQIHAHRGPFQCVLKSHVLMEQQIQGNFTSSRRGQINRSSAGAMFYMTCLSYIRSHLQPLRIPGSMQHTPQVCQPCGPSEVVLWLVLLKRRRINSSRSLLEQHAVEVPLTTPFHPLLAACVSISQRVEFLAHFQVFSRKKKNALQLQQNVPV